MALSDAYPREADDETRAFVRYWFDHTNRIHLTALSDSISRLHDSSLRNLMWCAFSRLIITKSYGASLAMDISHSRPHRCYDKAPLNALDHFERAVKQIIKASPFSGNDPSHSKASVQLADARKLPTATGSVDVVITSPPYLNAIDYVRGHKFSLIWMGHSVADLRKVRSTNVGTETATKETVENDTTKHIVELMCKTGTLGLRHKRMLHQYARDMRSVMSETKRVLRSGGKAVFVVGNCNLRETFVQNSKCIEGLAHELGFTVSKKRSRPLPENRRYLPPPGSPGAGKALKKRMREEVVLTLLKN